FHVTGVQTCALPISPVVLLSTEGLFCDLDSDPVALHPTGRDAGRRVVDCDADIVRGMIERGARYLAREVREDGRFNYGWHPCFRSEERRVGKESRST